MRVANARVEAAELSIEEQRYERLPESHPVVAAVGERLKAPVQLPSHNYRAGVV